MSAIDFSNIEKKLNDNLDENRYNHTLGVAYTSACLAMRYDYDIKKARLAGLLHDCAKCLSHEERIELCKNENVDISEAEYQNPSLLHAKAGAIVAVKEYNVDDDEILSAIRCHTTGKPNMSLLDKIIYIADFIEPTRREISCLPDIRKMAFIDLDKTLVMILENSLEYLKSMGCIIDIETQKTYDFYKMK
ncbi:putative HD superfamily hydrolase of NAD metabolism [Acetitomaculum ruminis DSM 5522]|uniref:bis(5'-nucleosyl)-tetraphosphatase (symmetrical) n=1 Tax=Acetitomaculum ruminis DSM 5522 TaxID=1120918 RepID=A0A1I0V738_9FIRM|nr:bis(5'-nucleosyl)-tetraphosphatase (symmetrical) YqeK [Acetitomaculum ruminis]SFA71867.1 putative HD superfamily hydrolase of NAD metabolism [Acetitomaculum ruminis DSM 5522]